MFRADGGYNFLEQPLQADVITCAVPYLAETGLGKISTEKYRETMRRRIANIEEVTKANGADILVLGAFACGAFANPPGMVEELFYENLVEQRQARFFEEAVFAIPTTAETPITRFFLQPLPTRKGQKAAEGAFYTHAP